MRVLISGNARKTPILRDVLSNAVEITKPQEPSQDVDIMETKQGSGKF